jgi:hypothetical protein
VCSSDLVGSVAGRLKEGGEEANALAKDLRTQLVKTDLDPGTRDALLSAFGIVAGRLKEGGEEANVLAKDLRTQLARTDLDPGTRYTLVFQIGTPSGPDRASTGFPGDPRARHPGPPSRPSRPARCTEVVGVGTEQPPALFAHLVVHEVDVIAAGVAGKWCRLNRVAGRFSVGDRSSGG